jgi:hypothetical protein
MEKHEFSKMKIRLQAQKVDLLRSLEQLAQQAQISAHEYGRDEGDRARSSHEKELLSRQTAQMRSRLNLIERALARSTMAAMAAAQIAVTASIRSDSKRFRGHRIASRVRNSLNGEEHDLWSTHPQSVFPV